MDKLSICIMCGCEVDARVAVCPMCGMPLEEAAPPRSASGSFSDSAPALVSAPVSVAGLRKGSHVRMGKFQTMLSNRKFVVLIAAAAFLLLVIAAAIAQAWLRDRSLHEQAADAEASKNNGVSAEVQKVGDTAIEAGNVAAGGIANVRNQVLYEASTDGIFYRDLDDVQADSGRRLASSAAIDINISSVNSRIAYITTTSSARAAFEGDEVCTIDLDSDEGTSSGKPNTLYKPSEKNAKLSCLSMTDSSCYFLEHSGEEYFILKLDLDAEQPETLHSTKADLAWLFVERDMLYLASSSTDAWSVSSSSWTDSSLNFTEVAKGSGKLATAAIESGKFYYSVAKDKDDTRLQRDDLRNGSLEYSSVVNPIRVAASGDVVAVMTKSGALLWMDAVTGVAHDLSSELNAIAPDLVPTSAALSVCGEWVCIADGKDGFFRINVNDSTTASSV